MASNALSGIGTVFQRWNTALSTPAWEKIAEVSNIEGPSMSRDTIDVTNLDSTDGYREFIASLRDAGTVVLTMNFTRAGYELMKDDFESDTRQNYEIIIPDASTTSLEFIGLVTELPLTVPFDDKIIMDVTIKISGKVTLNSGSGS